MPYTGGMRFKPYTFLVTIPDRLYPFTSYVEGKRVRWKRSYDHTLAEVRSQMGNGHYGYKLLAYRELFHFVGALLFITVATVVSHDLFGSDTALLVLFVAAVLAISYQEFYVHPRHYHQLWNKSMLDWATWVVPIGLYFFLFVN